MRKFFWKCQQDLCWAEDSRNKFGFFAFDGSYTDDDAFRIVEIFRGNCWKVSWGRREILREFKWFTTQKSVTTKVWRRHYCNQYLVTWIWNWKPSFDTFTQSQELTQMIAKIIVVIIVIIQYITAYVIHKLHKRFKFTKKGNMNQ